MYDVGQFPYMRYLVVVECSVVYVHEVFSPFLPMCLRWLMLSGPVVLAVFDCCSDLLSCDIYLSWF